MSAETTNSAAPWTTRRLLAWITGHFDSRGIEAPRLCAEMLLARTLGCERLRLYMDPDRPASEAERAELRALVRRVAEHEPVQYVVGEAWFHSRPFAVSPATLIPRPSTERLVEEAIDRLRQDEGGSAGRLARMLDLCTGSGCVAVSVALAKGVDVHVLATDVVPEALELAKRNIGRHGAGERVSLALGDLYEAIPPAVPGAAADIEAATFDVITANPPYVSDAEWEELEPNVRDYEPASALRGGADGLDLVRRVVAGAPSRLRPGGLLLVEIGHAQRDAVLELARRTPGLVDADILPDHEGFDRVLRAVRGPEG